MLLQCQTKDLIYNLHDKREKLSCTVAIVKLIFQTSQNKLAFIIAVKNTTFKSYPTEERI